MRDLAKDSRWLQRQEPNRDNHISVNFYRAYDWLNQAIRAEAEVERLKLMVKSITEGLDEAIETVHYLETENAKLRKVADAARVLSDIWSVGGKPNLSNLRYALAELDKAKEGQE